MPNPQGCPSSKLSSKASVQSRVCLALGVAGAEAAAPWLAAVGVFGKFGKQDFVHGHVGEMDVPGIFMYVIYLLIFLFIHKYRCTHVFGRQLSYNVRQPLQPVFKKCNYK